MAIAKFAFPQNNNKTTGIASESRAAPQGEGTAPQGREAPQGEGVALQGREVTQGEGVALQGEGTAPQGREVTQGEETAPQGREITRRGAKGKIKSLSLKDIRKKADELSGDILTFERENAFKLSFYEKVRVILEQNEIQISEKELLNILTAALLAYKEKGGKK